MEPLKPLPNSKPLTALIDNIDFPSSACNLSKTGSPKPTGTPLITHEITPPTVSPFFLTLLIRSIISSDLLSSGHLTIDFSMLSKFILVFSYSYLISPTEETNALILTPLSIILAIDPATTLTTVSLAELLPPPL